MVIALTDEKPEEFIYFIDTARRTLVVCYCTLVAGTKNLEDTNFVIRLEAGDSRRVIHSELFQLAKYKEGIMSKPEANIYLNKKYKIPKECDRVAVGIQGKGKFKIDCTIQIR